ncbi:MAG TPA: toxin-antitoxin system HicB family antitoxin [Acidimicrobiales bacterium]|nr:toxin-antitoxin system HicB family antitoxin [Acidimicrobiales bacterium]
MELRPYVESIQSQLVGTAEAVGEDAVALIGRLVAPMEAAIRLALQDLLAAAADEITCELAPGAVELRLRGREPELVVTHPPAGPLDGASLVPAGAGGGSAPTLPSLAAMAETPGLPLPVADGDEGGIARINVRMPEQLKARIERAAAGERLSANTWIVRASLAALERLEPERRADRRAPRGSERFSGWAR